MNGSAQPMRGPAERLSQVRLYSVAPLTVLRAADVLVSTCTRPSSVSVWLNCRRKKAAQQAGLRPDPTSPEATLYFSVDQLTACPNCGG